jgi:hypothetical protein
MSNLVWILGLSAAAVAVGGIAYAATRTSTPSTGSDTTPTLSAALQAVIALPADSLCQTNNTVQAFQAAWNAAGNTPTLTVDGNYDTATAGAAQSYNANAPAACTTSPSTT